MNMDEIQEKLGLDGIPLPEQLEKVIDFMGVLPNEDLRELFSDVLGKMSCLSEDDIEKAVGGKDVPFEEGMEFVNHIIENKESLIEKMLGMTGDDMKKYLDMWKINQYSEFPTHIWDGVIEGVREYTIKSTPLDDSDVVEKTHYNIDTNLWSFSLSKKYGVVPKVGDKVRTYDYKGSSRRGLDINGERVFYYSDDEIKDRRKKQEAKWQSEKDKEFEKNREQMDKDYEELPSVFQMRIDRFRDANPKFRVDNEGYEIFCCKEAIKVAEHCQSCDEVAEFRQLSNEKQLEVISDGHSGNTFGVTLQLAYWYLAYPRVVIYLHGALVYLVGCEEYGCDHDKIPKDLFRDKLNFKGDVADMFIPYWWFEEENNERKLHFRDDE